MADTPAAGPGRQARADGPRAEVARVVPARRGIVAGMTACPAGALRREGADVVVTNLAELLTGQ